MSKMTPEQTDEFILNIAKDVHQCVDECIKLINATVEKHGNNIRWNIAGRVVTNLWALVYRPTIAATFTSPDLFGDEKR